VETIALSDMEQSAQMLATFCADLTPETSLIPQ